VRAVQITQFGGPEVLRVVDIPAPVPTQGQVLIDVDSAGVNFADTHQIENSYLTPQTLPLVPGGEVVGRVVGGELNDRRVVALTLSGGGYAEQAVSNPATVFPLPDDVPDAAALALVLQGTSAWHLLRSCGHLEQGESVVVHAAAGGVGTLAVQLAKQWGAGRVIATASSPEKRRLALDLGADVAVDVSDAQDAAQVRDRLVEANGGHGVDIVLEMTGGHVGDGSLAALAPWGRLVVYGMASRTPATPVPPAALMARTRSVTGFWLAHALRRPPGLTSAMEELLSLLRAGRLRPVTGGSYPLDGAVRAHQELLARTTTGKLVLQLH
jgi:NADPH2:quinone reductase